MFFHIRLRSRPRRTSTEGSGPTRRSCWNRTIPAHWLQVQSRLGWAATADSDSNQFVCSHTNVLHTSAPQFLLIESFWTTAAIQPAASFRSSFLFAGPLENRQEILENSRVFLSQGYDPLSNSLLSLIACVSFCHVRILKLQYVLPQDNLDLRWYYTGKPVHICSLDKNDLMIFAAVRSAPLRNITFSWRNNKITALTAYIGLGPGVMARHAKVFVEKMWPSVVVSWTRK